MNTYIFLCDLDYYPDENYSEVIKAENLDQALDIWIENENKDISGVPISKTEHFNELFGDRITEVIEIMENNTYNHYSMDNGTWKSIQDKILHP